MNKSNTTNTLTKNFVNALLKLRAITKKGKSVEIKINENTIITSKDDKWYINSDNVWNPTFTEINEFLNQFKEFEIENAILDFESDIDNN